MTRQQLFPTLLIVIDVCAAAMYCYPFEWRKVAYWTAAAVLTYAVTW
jgi:hypothetical protein